jgi:hypothetical protein
VWQGSNFVAFHVEPFVEHTIVNPLDDFGTHIENQLTIDV